MADMLPLIVGWIMGLLGTIFMERLRIRNRRHQLQQAIRLELQAAASRLALNCLMIESRVGLVDRDFVLWLRKTLRTYSEFVEWGGLNPNDVSKVTELTDEQVKGLFESQKSKWTGAISMKAIGLPFLSSALSELSIAKTDFRTNVLFVYNQILILNQDVDDSRFYFKRTFDTDLSDQNREAVKTNLENSYRHIGRRCRFIVDKIDLIAK